MRHRWETPRSCFSLARSDSGSDGSAIRSRRFSRSSQIRVRVGQSRTSKESRQSPSCQNGSSGTSSTAPWDVSADPDSSGEPPRATATEKTASNPENPVIRREDEGTEGGTVPAGPAFKTGPERSGSGTVQNPDISCLERLDILDNPHRFPSLASRPGVSQEIPPRHRPPGGR